MIQAAKYLGVAPWDMAGIPETHDCALWFEWTMICMIAEGQAKQELQAHPERHQRETESVDLPDFVLEADGDSEAGDELTAVEPF